MIWHCRLCAELKPSEGLIDLNNDEAKCRDVFVKLSFLNAFYVNVAEWTRLPLPSTVCFDCCEALDKAHEFLHKVRNAQDVLSGLFPPKPKVKKNENEDRNCENVDTENDERLDRKPQLLLQKIKQELSQENMNDVKSQQDGANAAKVTEIVIEIDPKDCNTGDVKAKKPKAVTTPSTSKKARAQAKKVVQVQSWKEYPWTCNLCYLDLGDISSLRAHSISVHGKCAEYTCIICGKTFNYNSFVLHVKTHHSSLRNRCHYCDVPIDYENFNSHIDQHLESVTPCLACGVNFPDDTALQNHLVSVIQEKPPRKGRMPKAPEKERTCPICSKIFKHVSLLKKHVIIHRSDRKKEFGCDQCGSMFYTKNDLKYHFATHTDIRLHVCNICGMSFKHMGTLREHIKTHSNVKSFSCDTCGRSFHRRTQLETHKIRHTDVCPFSCQYCDKKFHFKPCLIKHERRHTGVKPYSCDDCNRTFADWGNYNKHMKRRHNRDMSKKKKS